MELPSLAEGLTTCLWGAYAFETSDGVSDLRNTSCTHFTFSAYFKAFWLVIHSADKMKTILKIEFWGKHMKTTDIKIHQFTSRE